MSAQNNQFNDIDHLKRTQEALLDGMTIMHKALSKIATIDTTYMEFTDMKAIAVNALADLNEISFGIGGKN